METRAKAKAKAEQSSSSPVSPLENPGQRPPSSASEGEGDLGLTSLLGEGEVLNVGENYTPESAMSGTCDVTVVAAQAPIKASVSVSLYGQTKAEGVNPLLVTTDTTTLPGRGVQAPIGSTQLPTLSLSRGSEPVQIPSLHQGEVQIPTHFTLTSDDLGYCNHRVYREKSALINQAKLLHYLCAHKPIYLMCNKNKILSVKRRPGL